MPYYPRVIPTGAGFTESDLPVEGKMTLDPEIPEVKPLPETKATKG